MMITERGVLYALVVLFGFAAGYLFVERQWLVECELEGAAIRLREAPNLYVGHGPPAYQYSVEVSR